MKLLLLRLVDLLFLIDVAELLWIANVSEKGKDGDVSLENFAMSEEEVEGLGRHLHWK